MPGLPKMFRRGRTWYVRLQTDGRDRWHSLGRDQRAAERRYKDVLARGPGAEVVRVPEAAQRWLASHVKSRRTEKNVKLATVRVARYLAVFFGYKPLDRVTREDVRQYRRWLEGKGLTMQSVAHVLSDARCFFRWAEDAELIARAPVPQRLLPRVPASVPRALSDDEVAQVLKVPDPWRFVIRLWLAAGVRWSEMVRLEAKHLTRDGWLLVEQPKTGKVVRVPLMETDPALAREIAKRVGKLVPYSMASVGTFNRKVKQLSGVAGFSSHRLRHTFATRWLQRGGSLVALQEVLGHSSIALTQRYARLTDAYVRAEARRQAAGAPAVAGEVADSGESVLAAPIAVGNVVRK